jgi:hypothetical protein
METDFNSCQPFRGGNKNGAVNSFDSVGAQRIVDERDSLNIPILLIRYHVYVLAYHDFPNR